MGRRCQRLISPRGRAKSAVAPRWTPPPPPPQPPPARSTPCWPHGRRWPSTLFSSLERGLRPKLGSASCRCGALACSAAEALRGAVAIPERTGTARRCAAVFARGAAMIRVAPVPLLNLQGPGTFERAIGVGSHSTHSRAAADSGAVRARLRHSRACPAVHRARPADALFKERQAKRRDETGGYFLAGAV